MLCCAGKLPGVGGEAVLRLGVHHLCAAERRSRSLHPHRGRLQTDPTPNTAADRRQSPKPLRQPGLQRRELQSALETLAIVPCWRQTHETIAGFLYKANISFRKKHCF